jgi:hypothetical protein
VRTRVTVRRAHKAGNAPGEYEDAWQVGPPAVGEALADSGTVVAGEPLRVAMADGATESFLAGRWARLLTSAFAEAPPTVTTQAEAFAHVVSDVAGQWPGELDEYVSGREAAARPLRWYERPGLERGAYATLLVLATEPDGGWHAAAVGDTCLFQVREDQLENAFPLAEAKAFGDAPPLLGSPDTDPAVVAPLVGLAQGTAAPGDRIYVCTDALAAWFLSVRERGGRPWELLDTLNEAFFGTWLEEAREKDQIRNDDVTLISVEFGDSA